MTERIVDTPPMLMAKLSFGEIADYFKDQRHTNKKGHLATNLYHWSDKPIGKTYVKKGFFASDKSLAFKNANYNGMYLYELTVKIKNPLVFLKQWNSTSKADFWDEFIRGRRLNSAAGMDVDAVIFTMAPGPNDEVLGQILIPYPNETITAHELLCRVAPDQILLPGKKPDKKENGSASVTLDEFGNIISATPSFEKKTTRKEEADAHRTHQRQRGAFLDDYILGIRTGQRPSQTPNAQAFIRKTADNAYENLMKDIRFGKVKVPPF